MFKVLVIPGGWLGDVVMSQILFKLLKQQQPDVLIDVLALSPFIPLLACMPEVHRAIPMPIGHKQLDLKGRYQLGRQLRTEQYQQAIVIPRSLKSALIPYWAKIPKRTGWRGEMRWGFINDMRKLDKKYPVSPSNRFLQLVHSGDIGQLIEQQQLWPKFAIPTDWIVKTQEKFNITELEIQKPVLILCPGAAYGPAKLWPTHYFAQVAREKQAQGWKVWILGSSKEHYLAAEIQRELVEKCLDFTTHSGGDTTIADVISLLSLGTAVISNDSGPMHLAAALGKPLVVPYGSSDPGFTVKNRAHIQTLNLELPCSPCMQRTCRFGHYQCLRDLKPAHVLKALHQLGY